MHQLSDVCEFYFFEAIVGTYHCSMTRSIARDIRRARIELINLTELVGKKETGSTPVNASLMIVLICMV